MNISNGYMRVPFSGGKIRIVERLYHKTPSLLHTDCLTDMEGYFHRGQYRHRLLLARLRDLQKTIQHFLVRGPLQTAIDIVTTVSVSAFYTCLYSARLKQSFIGFIRRAARRARRCIDRLSAGMALYTASAATALAAWVVISIFFAALYYARTRHMLRASRQSTRKALRLVMRSHKPQLQGLKSRYFRDQTWLFNAVRRSWYTLLVLIRPASADLLRHRLPPAGYLGAALQLLLFAMVFSLPLLRPIQAKAPAPASNRLFTV